MTPHQPRLRLVTDAAPPAATPHDGILLARVASGDVGALGGLYDSHAVALLRFARRLGGEHEAEDIVQNVFVRVVRLAPSFDPSAASARAWLFAITVRVVQERRRSLRRLAAALSALTQQKAAAPSARNPLASDLQYCLQRLSVAKRAVVVLCEIEGFSCEEIAEMLDVPVGTVWTRLHHARRELRAAWGETP